VVKATARSEVKATSSAAHKNEPASKNRYLAADSNTAKLWKQGQALMPGGTARLHHLWEPYPIFAHAGAGCKLVDVDGDERIDCLNNMTALIHGHCDPDISAALSSQVYRGASFSEACEAEVTLAQMIVDRVPTIEQIHFRSSGTEAIMIAVKLARAFTGRDRIAKFEGGYHGYYDYVQWSVGSTPANWGDALTPRNVRTSGGLAGSVERDVLTLPYNNRQGVERLLEQHGRDIAALLVEPLSNRSGMALPAGDFHDFLRDITRHYGIVLIFDEVIAFRVGPGGAQGRYGGSPDLTVFGKVIGGGLPIGAVGGRADLMKLMDPIPGPAKVASGGTYSGNPLSAVGGVVSLQKLTTTAFQHLDTLGKRMRDGMNAVFVRAGLQARAHGDASLFQIVPTDRPVENYRSVPHDAAANAWIARLQRALVLEGVIISTRGLGCLSTAMDNGDVDECLDAFERAVAALDD